MTASCPACAYVNTIPKHTFYLIGFVGATSQAVSDGVAAGIGTGLALAQISSIKRQQILDGFCEVHKRDLQEASAGLPISKEKEPVRAIRSIEVIDLAQNGTGPWKLLVNGYGVAIWPCKHEPRGYAEEVARVLRNALDALPEMPVDECQCDNPNHGICDFCRAKLEQRDPPREILSETTIIVSDLRKFAQAFRMNRHIGPFCEELAERYERCEHLK